MTSEAHVRRGLVDAVTAHIVSSRWAPRVVSPLHDVLSESDRRAILADNPDSYLHVTSDPLALPATATDRTSESVQADALRRLLDLGAYTAVPEPALFVYRLSERGRDHTGVIASVDVEGFSTGRVLGHEAVQPDRVARLVRHYQQVPTRSELVALVHQVNPLVADLTARTVDGPPMLSFTDASGVLQSVWQAGRSEAAALTRELSAQRLYIADGHHRVAAATACWEADRRPATVLCAIYPEHEIELHAFHRRVRGPVEVASLLEGLTARFEVLPARGVGDESTLAAGVLGLYAAGRWHQLRAREHTRPPGVAGLDVTVLTEQVLGPFFGIHREDTRLEYVPGLHDLGTVTRTCDADGGVLLTLGAPTAEDLMMVADRHEVMPSKTTYVQPKPRTGIFLS